LTGWCSWYVSYYHQLAIETSIIARERTIRARTDTIQYEYSSIHNSWYRYRMSTLCIGVPATYIIRPSRSVGEHSLYTMRGTCRPLATNQLAHSVSFKTGWFAGTLEWLTVDCCYHFLLVEGVRRHLLLVAKTQYCAVVVSWGGWYQGTVSLLPPLQPSPVSWIKWHVHSVGDQTWLSFDHPV